MPTKKRFTEESYRKEPWFKAVCSALLSCKSEEAMADMLRDIATLGELQIWGERLEVAKHLVKGLSYRQVAAITGASTTTVTRVAKTIENGTGGYRKLLHAHRHHRLVKQPQPITPVSQATITEAPNMLQEQPHIPAPTPTPETQQTQAESDQQPVRLLQKFLDRR